MSFIGPYGAIQGYSDCPDSLKKKKRGSNSHIIDLRNCFSRIPFSFVSCKTKTKNQKKFRLLKEMSDDILKGFGYAA